MDYNKIQYLKELVDTKQEQLGVLQATRQLLIEQKTFPFSILRNDPTVKENLRDTDTK
jgi:hypothetical protein